MQIKSYGSVKVFESEPARVRQDLRWLVQEWRARPELRAVWLIGSYHRQDFGPFSDIDLVLIVASSGERFLDRAEGFRPSAFPVPTDLLVYTLEEVEQMKGSGHPFWKHIEAHHTSLFEADR